jgi:hypothetical protein
MRKVAVAKLKQTANSIFDLDIFKAPFDFASSWIPRQLG